MLNSMIRVSGITALTIYEESNPSPDFIFLVIFFLLIVAEVLCGLAVIAVWCFRKMRKSYSKKHWYYYSDSSNEFFSEILSTVFACSAVVFVLGFVLLFWAISAGRNALIIGILTAEHLITSIISFNKIKSFF